MDVHRTTRERVFSILNDNNCPSFTHRQTSTTSASPPPTKLPSIAELTAFSPRPERPSLFRQPQFHRNSSISSAGSPPLLRYDSSSSAKSSSSMDSTPSPITPAYNYDSNLAPYETLLRQDPSLNYLPSPTGITPFMDQAMMIGPVPQEPFPGKIPQHIAPSYPTMAPSMDMPQNPTPTLSTNASISSASSAAQQKASNNGGPVPKKNKYPCPYAQSHSCVATFTTSGHAARHGKKHTGEKGVHCPVCDKAFTRKDNMKQHERTHKNRPAKDEEKKSKAQATREAAKGKEPKEDVTIAPQMLPQVPPQPAHVRKSSSGLSDPSDITLAPLSVNTPISISPTFFPDTIPQILLPQDTLNEVMPLTMYPALPEEPSASLDKLEIPLQPPALIRGFSDLDTLAQAAETFDPYFQQPQF